MSREFEKLRDQVLGINSDKTPTKLAYYNPKDKRGGEQGLQPSGA